MQISPSTALLQAISRAAAPAQTAAARPAAARAAVPPTAAGAASGDTGRPHRLPGIAGVGAAGRPDPNLPRGSLLDISV